MVIKRHENESQELFSRPSSFIKEEDYKSNSESASFLLETLVEGADGRHYVSIWKLYIYHHF